jgi:hypothetical protein
MKNLIRFVDYINDSVRLLIILETARRLKPRHRVNEHRIKLYDFYLKFPCTMFSEVFINDIKVNFDEYYAFFHWKPDIARYRSSLNYLISKSLIEKRFEENELFYTICPQGVEAIADMKGGYKQRLVKLSEEAFVAVSALSDKKIEEEIDRKRLAITQNWRKNQ